MKIKRKNFMIFVYAIVILMNISACGGASSNDSQSTAKGGKKIINIGITNVPGTINPLSPTESVSQDITSLNFIPLVDLDSDDLKYKPMLADSIETKDNISFTVKLNENAKWSDGKPVTADDAIFTFKLITNPKVKSQITSNFSTIEGLDDTGFAPEDAKDISGIKKIDEHTIQFKTKSVVALDLFQDKVGRNFRIVPEHILKDIDPANILKDTFFQSPSVVDGPFKLVKYEDGQYAQLSANESYFKGTPKLDELNFKIMQGSNITAQLQSGEIDMNFPLTGSIPVEDYDKVKELSNVTTINGSPITIQYLIINVNTIKDAKVRKAISYAIDRKSIVTNLLKNQGEVLEQPFVSNNAYINKNIVPIEYNPEKAKQLLAEAGWDSSKTLTFNVPTGNKTREQAGDIIVENLKKVGINAQVSKYDFSTIMTKSRSHDFDLTIIGISTNPSNPFSTVSFLLNSGGNFSGYSNSVIDGLVKNVESATNYTQTKEAYDKIQEIIDQDVSSPALYASKDLKAVNKRITVGIPKEYGSFIDVYKWDVKD